MTYLRSADKFSSREHREDVAPRGTEVLKYAEVEFHVKFGVVDAILEFVIRSYLRPLQIILQYLESPRNCLGLHFSPSLH